MKNSVPDKTMLHLTPMTFSSWLPMVAPTQNAIIMMLNVRATSAFSSPNVAHIGAANMENA